MTAAASLYKQTYHVNQQVKTGKPFHLYCCRLNAIHILNINGRTGAFATVPDLV